MTRLHRKFLALTTQVQRADASSVVLLLGPDRTTSTLPPAARAAAIAVGSGVPEALAVRGRQGAAGAAAARPPRRSRLTRRRPTGGRS